MTRDIDGTAAVNIGRHKRNCSVCGHAQREEIESAFIGWRSPEKIAEDYGLADRASVYRHAHALNLFPKRQRNIRAALERIIEKAGEVEVTASAVVVAIQAYCKITETGQWIDRTEIASMDGLAETIASARARARANVEDNGFAGHPASDHERNSAEQSETGNLLPMQARRGR